MSISVSCPDCGKTYKVSDTLAGKTGRCKACGGVLAIPEAGAAAPELDPYAVLAEDTPPRKTTGGQDEYPEVNPPRGPKPAKAKSRRSQAAENGETDPIYKYGFGTVIFGVLGFVMPFLGIQFKGIGELPIEAQLIIFGLAILIGTGLLIGGKPANTFQRVAKYIWLTLIGFLVLGFTLIMALGILGILSGVKPPAPDGAEQPPPQAPPQQADNRALPTVPPPANVPQTPLAPPVVNTPQNPPSDPAGERPPGIKPVIMGTPLFALGNSQVIRRQGTEKYEVEFRIEYQVTGNLPPGTQFFAVGESRKSKSNIPIRQLDTPNGQVSWTSTMTDGDTGPFRVFFATVTFDAPAGKSWVQVSNVVRGIPLTGN